MDCVYGLETLSSLPPTGPLVVRAGAREGRHVKLSMVVPTYNESQNIAELLDVLRGVLSASVGDAYELIVVDDNSPDRTWEIAAAIASRDPRVVVLRRTQERGLATAVVRGWQLASGEVLGVIDGDLQHPPEVTAQLWAAIQHGAELAVASRRVEGGGVGEWNLFRRFISRGAQWIGLVLLPGIVGQVSDPMSGCFLVRRSTLQGVALNPSGYKILLEVLGRGRLRLVTEVGYVFRIREKGASKATLGVYWDYLLHLLRLRFRSLSGSSLPSTEPAEPGHKSAAAGGD